MRGPLMKRDERGTGRRLHASARTHTHVQCCGAPTASSARRVWPSARSLVGGVVDGGGIDDGAASAKRVAQSSRYRRCGAVAAAARGGAGGGGVCAVAHLYSLCWLTCRLPAPKNGYLRSYNLSTRSKLAAAASCSRVACSCESVRLLLRRDGGAVRVAALPFGCLYAYSRLDHACAFRQLPQLLYNMAGHRRSR